jgi:phosphonate degradation associated HDIG domain protein
MYLNPHLITSLYRDKGNLYYDGEGVSQVSHAWQCGMLSRKSGASPNLQLAAWLHDIGHLLSKKDGTPTIYGHDDRHEQIGGSFLAKYFSEEVSQPVLLHVLAKRYLVATKPEYFKSLSPDSIRSLQLQGGPMTASECEEFISKPYAQEALALRNWDDLGKDRHHETPPLDIAIEDLTSLVEQCK